MKKANDPLPDSRQREMIVNELDKTLLVEAAAGTGKTTSIVDRMTALLARGKCGIETLAAVTFTRKAAAELRSRFQARLEKQALTTSSEVRERLDDALKRIEQCFIGTIHSFCARLLRERPVEADVDIAFQEADDAADALLLRQAWDEHVAALYAANHRCVEEADRIGLSISDLQEGFAAFARHPDITDWPAPAVPPPDERMIRRKLITYGIHMASLSLPKEYGTDTLIPLYRRISWLTRNFNLDKTSALIETLELFGKVQVRHTYWGGKEKAQREERLYNDFLAEVVEPALAAWRAERYRIAIEIYRGAAKVYDRMRHEAGVLNYQDLLLKAAGLLRDNGAHIREYFARRFTHILVDEFQDTDPLQAEVMLLLTADDPAESDWRRCRPRPGALAVVGDPKQSIYRFRRADIVTYNQVKDIITRNGGLALELFTNFRSAAALLEWVNGVFAPEFPPEATEFSPGYAALAADPRRVRNADAPPIQRIVIPGNLTRKETIIPYEADFIARTIRKALDERMPLPRSERELANGMPPYATPGDFMIITFGKKNLGEYAKYLRQYGIPCQLTGGNAMARAHEPALLRACLAAAVHPENPILLVAALRGEIFGVSDPMLYELKRAGGEFDFNARLPDGVSAAARETIGDAFRRLRKYQRWLMFLPPVAAIEKVVADMGFAALAAAEGGNNGSAGTLLKALELLRAIQVEKWTAADLIDCLGEITSSDSEEHDGLTPLPVCGAQTRLMNLHKAKGLEAPIVFLADPTGAADHGVELYGDRGGATASGFMAISRGIGDFHREPLAQPYEWAQYSAREKAFGAMERLRLFYVAATRAGTQLIISQRENYSKNNPWNFFGKYLNDAPRIEDAGERKAPRIAAKRLEETELTEARAAIASRWSAVMNKTYDLRAAREAAFDQNEFAGLGDENDAGGGGDGDEAERGNVIHLMLEMLMRNPQAEPRDLAVYALRAHGLPLESADEAVRIAKSVVASEIWRRAQRSRRRFAELPFSWLLPSSGAAAGLPTVMRGKMDLVFEESDGWVIVDYKTGKDLPALAEHYLPQLETYADAWRQCAGERVKEVGLYFVSTGQYRPKMMGNAR